MSEHVSPGGQFADVLLPPHPVKSAKAKIRRISPPR
jgi:hypothetical protein